MNFATYSREQKNRGVFPDEIEIGVYDDKVDLIRTVLTNGNGRDGLHKISDLAAAAIFNENFKLSYPRRKIKIKKVTLIEMGFTEEKVPSELIYLWIKEHYAFCPQDTALYLRVEYKGSSDGGSEWFKIASEPVMEFVSYCGVKKPLTLSVEYNDGAKNPSLIHFVHADGTFPLATTFVVALKD